MIQPVKPILFLDVDGAVCAYGAPPGQRVQRVSGVEVPIDPKNRERLAALHGLFEIIWCTDWEANANLVGDLFGLPELPHVPREYDLPPPPDLVHDDPCDPFSQPDDFLDERGLGSHSMHRKIPALKKYIEMNELEARPFAWVDDHINATARRFASELPVRTLLLRTRRFVGLTDEIVDQLVSFANE